ncbi:LysR family transcriptional regulator [Streptomyces chattanoogensis]
MDLGLDLVRAFAMTARKLRFGRAAEELKSSQQPLSKRIARLDATGRDCRGCWRFDCSSGRAAGRYPADRSG